MEGVDRLEAPPGLRTRRPRRASQAVLCDWTLYPGSEEDAQAPSKHEEFMAYMENSGRAAMSRQTLRNKDVFSVSQWMGAV